MPDKASTGMVFLVGAGPGDPGLMTLKGADCIARADVLIYDFLAAKALLDHARPDCHCIYVGKQGGDHTLAQEEINRLIVEKARAGMTVTRLKGGDPFIFGRGGEEAEELVAAGIPFEIVPGVTSAIAAPAYAGIPLTHRRFTATVAFVTGHEDPTKEQSNIDWRALAQGIGTLVFLMGVKNLPHIVDRLLANGRRPDTPVALVRWGTTAQQQTVTGTLADIAERVRAAGLKAPAIIVVGEVVGLREQLQWFERRPLLGKRIVVTRARAQASDLIRRLSALGAECLQCPTIQVTAPDSWQPLDQAIAQLDRYHWIVFTSVNGVDAFFDRLDRKGLDVRALGHLRTAAIGPATAERLKQRGLNTDILPDTYQAESVVAAFARQSIQNCNILLPRAKEARSVLPDELRRMGAAVDEVTAYQTLQSTENSEKMIALLQKGAIDMVTFTSSSTARNFKALLPKESPLAQLLKGVTVACIGDITAATAKELGFTVDIVAETFTIDGLCEAIVRHYTAPQ
ncbi:uroporphyrinogen-III C-methyltransferase [Desulfatitalea alkaliphila]|uniref:uroporphyrinogen-III C-methyltransferase n=1 Tax=Desulfatitalea alkaliphila TaxID=2929485 RepID=A0AA41R4D8_9BACT|nr:uroporphyrinogen-III C-methyltransferase [Desulfatitalea alkaliphila]MCJ8500660.1 uroporphyrinogen-III C-methyltransferase [Desulfatitalea alkaliphila]